MRCGRIGTLIGALMLLFMLPVASVAAASDPVYIQSGDLDTLLYNPSSTYTFYAAGLYWVFAWNGTYFGYYFSQDGLSWSSFHPIEFGGSVVNFGYDTAVYFDGQKVMIAGNDNLGGSYAPEYMQGTPLSDGSIAWDSPPTPFWQSTTAERIHVRRGADGYPIISWVYMWSANPLNVTAYVARGPNVNGSEPWTEVYQVASPDAFEIKVEAALTKNAILVWHDNCTVSEYVWYTNGTITCLGLHTFLYDMGMLQSVHYNDTAFFAFGTSDRYNDTAIVFTFFNETYLSENSLPDMFMDACFGSDVYPDMLYLRNFALGYDTLEKRLYAFIQLEPGNVENNVIYVSANWSWTFEVISPAFNMSGVNGLMSASGASESIQLLFVIYDTQDHLYHFVMREGTPPPPPLPSDVWYFAAYDTYAEFQGNFTYAEALKDNDTNTYWKWTCPVLDVQYEVPNNPYTAQIFGLSAIQSNLSVAHIYWDLMGARTTIFVIPYDQQLWAIARVYFGDTPPRGVSFAYSGWIIVPDYQWFTNRGDYDNYPGPSVYVDWANRYIEAKFMTSGIDPYQTGDDRYKLEVLWTVGDWYYRPSPSSGGVITGNGGGIISTGGGDSTSSTPSSNEPPVTPTSLVADVLDSVPEPLRVPVGATIVGLPFILLLIALLGKGAGRR